ncbi:ATP cone domain-containing protein [Sphingobacterium sp. LRF_L2]|uniref:ATP cone domain-containing protein n=1 Tax=Sphingobacterium sp. LRF_L2 TaxID=3369421 RepID=UPI003F626688
MNIRKYSGELVPFNAESLRNSLAKSGASSIQVEKVYRDIQSHLYDGIGTRELYEIAFNLLKTYKGAYAARYSLKKALRELGPEGFYFERWISKLFIDGDYKAITSQTIQGHAVTHEIDVVAAKDDRMLAIECKFRNDIDAKISVTTPMYFKSRFIDITDQYYSFFGQNKKFTEGWLVTNAYFTIDSKEFSSYYNINLLGWDYPAESSLKVRVDNNGLYPITCLTTLTDLQKSALLKQQCILVQELVDNPSFLNHIEIKANDRNQILQEAQELLDRPRLCD